MPRVLVTGATGFVGPWVCKAFHERGWTVVAAVRDAARARSLSVDSMVLTGDLDSAAWSSFPPAVDCVVHLAARAHRLSEHEGSALEAYRAVNVEGTRRLVAAARSAGVKHLILVSSVKAMGEERADPYTEADTPRPASSYGVSKLEAERAAAELLGGSATALTIVRPTMVYGPGGKGNVPRLLKLARAGAVMPLPLGAVRNRRSFLFVGNLADALLQCALTDAARDATFLLSDGEDVSTPELLRRVADVSGRPMHLFDCPVGMLRRLARLAGREAEAARLLDSLYVNTGRIERQLGWTRPFTLEAGLRRTVQSR